MGECDKEGWDHECAFLVLESDFIVGRNVLLVMAGVLADNHCTESLLHIGLGSVSANKPRRPGEVRGQRKEGTREHE